MLLKSNKGYSTAYTVIILFLIFALFGFAIDYGRVFLAKRLLQSWSDSAVLAGASMVRVEFSNVDFTLGTSGNEDTSIVFTEENKVLSESLKAFELNVVSNYGFKKDDMNKLYEKDGMRIKFPQLKIVDGKVQCITSVEIPMFSLVAFLGQGSVQKATVISEALPSETL